MKSCSVTTVLMMRVLTEWSSSKSLLMFLVKVSGINSSHPPRNILSQLREPSWGLDKCSKRFRLLLSRWHIVWSINTGSSVKNYSAAIVVGEKYIHVLKKLCAQVCSAVYTQASHLLKIWSTIWFITYIYIYIYIYKFINWI